MNHTLDQIKKVTQVVADTGDFQSIHDYQPQDATTNPSLILKALQKDDYKPLFERTVETVAKQSSAAGADLVDEGVDHVLVAFGSEILKIVPGRVSTEVDARLSFDTGASVAKARQLIRLYEERGIDRERVLIKLATTWEGVEAARQLEAEGIHCNMTLLFSMAQAVACAEAGAKLISPFVGRILDWYKANTNKTYTAENDPGVESVRAIYHYYKKFGYKTEIMGASFRNVGEIIELAGCDLLTISPGLLKELSEMNDPAPRKLDPEAADHAALERVTLNEAEFRWMLNEDRMATEKLSDGIRIFYNDMVKVREMIQKELRI